MQSPDMMNGRGPMQSDMMRDRAMQHTPTTEATPELRREHREKRHAEEHISPQGAQHANENAGFDSTGNNQPISSTPKADQDQDQDRDQDRVTDTQKDKARTTHSTKSKKHSTKTQHKDTSSQ